MGVSSRRLQMIAIATLGWMLLGVLFYLFFIRLLSYWDGGR